MKFVSAGSEDRNRGREQILASEVTTGVGKGISGAI